MGWSSSGMCSVFPCTVQTSEACGTHRVLSGSVSVIRTCALACGMLSTDWRPVHSSECFFFSVVSVVCPAVMYRSILSGPSQRNHGVKWWAPYGHPSRRQDLLYHVSFLVLGFTKHIVLLKVHIKSFQNVLKSTICLLFIIWNLFLVPVSNQCSICTGIKRAFSSFSRLTGRDNCSCSLICSYRARANNSKTRDGVKIKKQNKQTVGQAISKPTPSIWQCQISKIRNKIWIKKPDYQTHQ